MALHHHIPDHYHLALGTYLPALHIDDGDSVVTSTLDAGGGDANGQSAWAVGNPQTGPFYVTGAEPGDTLAVRLDRLWPSRNHGFSGTRLAPHVVDPGYVKQLPDHQRAHWELDLEAGTATLAGPTHASGTLTIPMRPMLGCFGVAPAGGQAISTATSGPYGGNMDYKGFEQDTVVYFPVAVPGALFFLGDGHAVQGCGEILGTGIETSFDAQFSVRVIKGVTIGWPRAENATHYITAGNARPLDQALQHATTEMMRWILDSTGWETPYAHAMLGQCVEYEVGNVFDPAYTMICKLKKELLQGLTGPQGMSLLPEGFAPESWGK